MTTEVPATPETINGPWVIVCEGDADKYFFRKLLEKNNIKGIDTPFPRAGGGGISQFPDMLQALAKDFPRITGGVIIVADAKDDENQIFTIVARQIKLANNRGSLDYPIPRALNTLERSTGEAPSVIISMLPGNGGKGGLETLCLKAYAKNFQKELACVEEYIKCTGVDGWKDSEKSDKARLQTLIAGTHKRDPNNALKYAVQKGVIPLNDDCFAHVVALLKSL